MSDRPSDPGRPETSAYAALASGLGTLARAAELSVLAEADAVSLRETQVLVDTADEDFEFDLSSLVEEAPRPSNAYLRVLEELRQYVREEIADAALEASLRDADVTPDIATSFDLREALSEVLPELLGNLLAPHAFDEVIERLHLALTDVHRPARSTNQ